MFTYWLRSTTLTTSRISCPAWLHQRSHPGTPSQSRDAPHHRPRRSSTCRFRDLKVVERSPGLTRSPLHGWRRLQWRSKQPGSCLFLKGVPQASSDCAKARVHHPPQPPGYHLSPQSFNVRLSNAEMYRCLETDSCQSLSAFADGYE